MTPYVGAELRDVYAAAALLVGRSGAGTVTECCGLGVPAVFVPLPGASGDEQTANARLVEAAGGAVVLPQGELTAESLVDTLTRLLAEVFRQRSTSEWVALLEKAGVPNGPINDIAQVYEEPQVKARSIRVDMDHNKEGEADRIDREIHFSAPLDEEQRKKLAEIAEKTPVTLTLKRGAEIVTTLHSGSV